MRAIVVDYGSIDGSAGIARDLRARRAVLATQPLIRLRNSTPSAPPPRTSSRRGSALTAVASRLSHGCTSAKSGTGGTAGLAPVATAPEAQPHARSVFGLANARPDRRTYSPNSRRWTLERYACNTWTVRESAQQITR